MGAKKKRGTASGVETEPPNRGAKAALSFDELTFIFAEGAHMGDDIDISGSDVAGTAVGRGASVEARDISVAAPDDPVDGDQFRDDITDILDALVDEKERIESELADLEATQEELRKAFSKLRETEVSDEKVAEIHDMISEIWAEDVSAEFEPTVEKLADTETLKAILNSPVLAGLVSGGG